MAKAKAEFENSDEIESMFDVGVDDTGWLDEILKRSKSGQIDVLSNMLAEAAKSLDPDYEEKAAWIPQKGPQVEAFNSLADELFFGGSAGGGKGWCKGELIVTPFGFKKVEELKRGDLICNPDGTVQKVIRLYDMGEKPFYRIKFIDGSEISATDDHLWLHWYASRNLKSQKTQEKIYGLYSPDKGLHFEITDKLLDTTEGLYEYHKKQEEAQAAGKRPYWILIPLTNPVKYTYPISHNIKPMMFSPYILGVLLGDGCITGRASLSFASIGPEIVERMENELSQYGLKISNINQSRDRVSHNIILQNRGDENVLIKKLEGLKLWGTRSNTKFIPKPFLFGSVEDRIALAQGLMDTDGYVDDRGHFTYTTVSPQLRDDVRQLFMSLGCKVTVYEKPGRYRNDEGEMVECQLAYNLYIQGEHLDRFVYLPRKKDRCKAYNGGVAEPGRRIVSIEKEEMKQAYCISVSNPNGLFLAGDFIVTHNTDLLIGLAVSERSPHQRSIIFRETYGDLKDIAGRVLDIVPTAKFVAGREMLFRNLPKNKVLELGNIPDFARAKRKYQGRPHDLKLFDELTNIEQAAYVFLNGWNRTTVPGLRTRIVSAGNPPTTERGLWVVQRFAPWLDPDHPNPAQPGELRWFSTINGNDKELTGGDGGDGTPFEYVTNRGDTEIVYPKSRTFIPSRLDDNEYYNRDPTYRATLQALPEPYRSMMLYGDFTMAVKPDQWQVIQRAWINQSVDVWKRLKESGDLDLLTLSDENVSYGVDVATTGEDSSCITRMVGNIVQYIEFFKEEDLMKQADIIAEKIYPKTAPIGIDENGIGLGLGQRLKQMGFNVLGFKGSTRSKGRTEDGQLGFENVRCEIWWRIRERLNPNNISISVKKDGIIIPDNPRLIGELTAPRYSVRGSGLDAKIWIDSTDEIKKKIARSPDGANSLGLCLMTSKHGRTKFRMV